MSHLDIVDPEVAELIRDEERRQTGGLELIASENFTSAAVLEAQGSVLTNKYAEGYPGARYYGGCEVVDRVEELVRDRARKLFGADHVNAQPHSGSQANAAAFYALLKKGKVFLAMDLAHGGHITHGLKKNFSGRFFKARFYGVDARTERIDYESIHELAREHRPMLIVAGATAYPRVIDFERMAAIAQCVGASLLVDMAHIAGLVAAGLHPSPVPHADVVTFTTHKTLRGPRSGMILCREPWASKIDAAVFPGTQGGPLMHIIAAKAVALREAATPEFHRYQESVLLNARVLGEELTAHGYRMVSGGTDNHLVLIDLRGGDDGRPVDGVRGPSGQQAEDRLASVGITANKNLIPYDPRPPREASGIRLGSAALTARGMGAEEFRLIGRLIARALDRAAGPGELERIRGDVGELSRSHPLPGLATTTP